MEKISQWKKRIEERIREVFKPEGPPLLKSAMAYYLFQEGKRIRPLFTVSVTQALGGEVEDAITVGACIEMIHNYSLIHDDLPAMDNDDFRRGQPSCHKKFGEAIAILAGDALLTYAFEVLSDRKNYSSLKEDQIIGIIRILSQRSGSGGMVGGQVLDIERKEPSYKVNLLKTAALFEACFLCGGIISEAYDMLKDLSEIGRDVGLLFQMVDDIIDRDGFWQEVGDEESRRKGEELGELTLEKIKKLFGKRGEEVSYLTRLIIGRITE